MLRTFLFCLLFTSAFAADTAKKDPASLQSLYNSLDPLSLSQQLAFYELYPDTEEGKKAVKRAWELLNRGRMLPEKPGIHLPPFDIQAIIALVNRQSSDPPLHLKEEELAVIDHMGSRLHNRTLKGRNAWTKEEVLKLPPEEVDLSRGLLLHEFEDTPEQKEKVKQYEASLDLMALQILARLPSNASSEDKIREINRFIFQEMQFRFPPHSLYAKDIDLYTFLPSVLDSRKGVCLGVSILYLCLAQRLDLPLEIITPPGHIYVRYHEGEKIINIETTARGIDLPSDTYLGINTRSLEQRTIKEVIGLAFFNQASVAWARDDHAATVKLYEKALLYLPDDPLLSMLLGINYLFTGKKTEGKKCLEKIRGKPFDYAVAAETAPDDYLSGKVDVEGLKAVFQHVDETRESIISKQKELEKILSKYPKFRAGLLQLATTWLQLGRSSEALEILEKYHRLDASDPTVEYYLSIICIGRYDYNQAWKHLKRTEIIVKKRGHDPKALKGVRAHLRCLCPEPV